MKQEKKQLSKGVWKLFFGFFVKARLNWWIIALLMALALGKSYLYLHLPGSTAGLLAGEFTKEALMQAIAYYLSTAVLMAIVSALTVLVKTKTVKKLRMDSWNKMMHTRALFYDTNNPQELMTAVTNDTPLLVDGVMNFFTNTLPGIYSVVGGLLIVRNYHPKLALITLITIPVYGISAFVFGRWQLRTTYSVRNEVGKLTGFLAERLRNLPLIKSFAKEADEAKSGRKAVDDLYKAEVNNTVCATTGNVFRQVSEVAITVTTVLVGAMLLRNEAIDLEAWLAFFLFVPMICSYVYSIEAHWISLKSMQGTMIRYSRILTAPSETNRSTKDQEDIPSEDLKLEHITFGYANREVLKDVSITIPKGKTTAIVGTCGSGKTTMLKLIERFYTPQKGSITVGGRNVEEFDITAWRNHLSYVQQDAGVFSGSIRSCLTYGLNRQHSEEDLRTACELAGLSDFIHSLPNGMDTDIAAWGSSLSGGQRQRLAIARELLCSAEVLILDEPTSALDADTAADVVDTIRQRFHEKTIVAATHELNFIASADQIVVLDAGKVVGQGTHHELMKNCPVYHNLVEEQSYQEVYAQ